MVRCPIWAVPCLVVLQLTGRSSPLRVGSVVLVSVLWVEPRWVRAAVASVPARVRCHIWSVPHLVTVSHLGKCEPRGRVRARCL